MPTFLSKVRKIYLFHSKDSNFIVSKTKMVSFFINVLNFFVDSFLKTQIFATEKKID